MNKRNWQMLNLNMLYVFIKINELTMSANLMGKKFQQNNVYKFWKEVKVINSSKVPLTTSIDGLVGAENIVHL